MSNPQSTAVVPMADLDRYAQAFAASGMFGAKTKDQAMSLLLLAQAEGMHPAIAMRDFDIIQGRPAKKAEAMHRSFLAAGGKIEWHKLSDDLADATFSHPAGGSVRITWDMARAKKAGIGGKDMYSKYPRQMLKARCISEGCRTVYPAATSGLYVPDEVVAFAPKEKDMGKAEVVHEPAAPLPDDVDVTLDIPGQAAPQAAATPSSSSTSPAETAPKTRTDILMELCSRAKFDYDDILKRAEVKHADEMADKDYADAKAMLEKRAAKKAA